MATIEFHYHSKAMKRQVSVNVILPEAGAKAPCAGNPGTPYKTLYLLHGLSGDQDQWMKNCPMERYAREYGIAVVMPNADRSWYTDTAYGDNYLTFISRELPAVCRGYFKGMSERREDNYIAGISMGGYGAVKIALQCPESFCGCATLSGALDITRKGRPVSIPLWRSIFGFDLQSPDQLAGTEHDIYALAQKNFDAGLPFPKLFVWCGTEDPLLEYNQRFHTQLEELGIDHYYEQSQGDHSWKWWDKHIQNALKYLFRE